MQPSYGLNDAEIEHMLEESIEHAEQDFAERQLIEARNEAETDPERHGEIAGAVDGRSRRIARAERAAPLMRRWRRCAKPWQETTTNIRARMDELNQATCRWPSA